MNKFFSDNVIEALNFINQFKNKIFVIKIGGTQISDEKIFTSICSNIKTLYSIGINIVLVHGGGKEISKRLLKVGIKSEFINGYRITSENHISEIEMILSGKINKDITLKLNNIGVTSVGLNGKDGGMISCSKKSLINDIDIGMVGEIDGLNLNLIRLLLKERIIPIISPIGFNKNGETFNINADQVAGSIASELKSEKLILLTDVDGYYKNINDKDSFVSKLNLDEVEKILNDNKLNGGMYPKLECCYKSVSSTRKTAHIINGNVKDSLLIEVLSYGGIGTMIYI
ncbi:acetylglutamate kinase [Helicovermis profundi]|uniref:Acetylglutamate kinase n=1 Tax=Helicovermis profundi TaxID=3065157 RepID=A0AAU9EHR5_9FIRM|nr:acetylglutamate kinase [Clostridia bacterium S502]